MDRQTVFAEYESNVRSYCRTFPALFDTAHDSWLITRDGNRYLDFLSAAGSLNYGHNDPFILSRIIAYLQRGGVVQSLDLFTEAKSKFLEDFTEHILLPRNMNYKIQFTGPTGANAVEAALKLARRITGRQNVISFSNAYHGLSLGSLALTANSVKRAAAGVTLQNTTFFPYDGFLDSDIDTSSLLRTMLTKEGSGIELPAAVIVETVQGEGGLSHATPKWLRSIDNLCKEINALLIIDDIQAGCGRTGSFFSFEGVKINPDMIVLSKSLSGFGTPMSILLMRPDQDVWQPGEHTGTFRGNNLGFVGASAAIEKFWTSNEFELAIKHKADVIYTNLVAIRDGQPPGTIKIVGHGMITGLWFKEPTLANTISANLFQEGIVCETCGPSDRVLKLLPPLTIKMDDLGFGLACLKRCVDKAFNCEIERSLMDVR